jgi:hypothetical protein
MSTKDFLNDNDMIFDKIIKDIEEILKPRVEVVQEPKVEVEPAPEPEPEPEPDPEPEPEVEEELEQKESDIDG